MEADVIQQRILQDMSEGVLVIGLNGRIAAINPAACEILVMREELVIGSSFVDSFVANNYNDSFSQTILDAIYDTTKRHSAVVPYEAGGVSKHLQVTSSFLREGGKTIAVICVISDITAMVELQEEIEAKNRQITALLDSMVETLSTAIDERSHYTANHTRNMVRYGEAFLSWLDRTGHPLRFSEESRRAFLMSVWLHDVGKLVVPLEVMDKATRLGPRLDDIRTRFRIISLVDRNAELSGKITRRERECRDGERREALTFIERINRAGFLPDADFALVQELSRRTWEDENGITQPWLTEEECLCLSIRRGTLTDDERSIMQSHVTTTARILSHVSFPASYAQVPIWAAEHHEQLNGRGYPNHLSGKDISISVRLLTILDIFEALTARDRPYKPPMPLDRALSVLHSMVDEGALDGDLLALFQASRAWEGILDAPGQLEET